MRTVTTWSDLLRPGDASSFFDRNPLPAFDPAANGYSAANAWWLAELSRLVYRHDVDEDKDPLTPLRSTFLAQAGLRQVFPINSEETGTQGFLVESTRAPFFAALVFRGTEQKTKDYQIDADAIQEPVGDGDAEVHEGFVKALDSVWKEVVSGLEKITSPVFFTGHSLGAGLATLAASRRRPTAVYTFGSPRVGNEAFCLSLKDMPIYRVVDDSDLVTKLPPEALGYRHVGELHQLTAPSTSDFDLIHHPPKPLADHAPINYVERLQ